MVASIQAEIPFYKGIGRQCGQAFGAIAQVIRRSAIPFSRKFSSQLQNAWVLTCWNLLCQKLQMLLSVEKKTRRLQKVWEDKLWENNWVVVAEKEVETQSYQEIRQNKPVGREDTFLQTFLINPVEYFSVPTFCGSFSKSWRESPSSWRCLVVPRTRKLSYYLSRWKLHKLWISKRSELIRWFGTDVFGFETEICQGWWLRNLQLQRSKKGAQRRG